MTTGNRQREFSFEARLAGLNLTAADREEALAAAHRADQLIAAVEYIGSSLKRLTEVVTFKTRARA